MIPNWFPIDDARQQFAATYPFHPAVLSVFERKWQTLPRFQQTRGVLRLLAHWVSHAYQRGFKGAHRDGLIGLGTAPLDDPLFRRAVFEQLGEDRLEGAITTDIIGKPDAFAVRLDAEAVNGIKKARLHQKVAASIFFESSGGQQQKEATLPEIRLAVAEPDIDMGNVETVLETLESSCYFLTVQKNRYRFSLTPNLNKLLSDRRANIKPERIDKQVKETIQKVFAAQTKVERVYFPEKSNQVPDRPAITLIVLDPGRTLADKSTLPFIDQVTREYGNAGRTYKSALLWAVPESSAPLTEEARNLLAWEDIDAEESERLDEAQKHQRAQNLKKAERDLREAVWRCYKNVALLGRDNQIRVIDLGLIHSSAANSITDLILTRLRQDDEAVEAVNPNFLIRNWPPALQEWSTRNMRDAFFASPMFPRLLAVNSLKDTIARGVINGILAYVGKAPDGKYTPIFFETDLNPNEVEFSDDMFLMTAEEARKLIKPPYLERLELQPSYVTMKPGEIQLFTVKGIDQRGQEFPAGEIQWKATGGEIDSKGLYTAGAEEGTFAVTASAGSVMATVTVAVAQKPIDKPKPKETYAKVHWSGEIAPQKWMQFYSKFLGHFVKKGHLSVRVQIEASPENGITLEQAEQLKIVLQELGLDARIDVE